MEVPNCSLMKTNYKNHTTLSPTKCVECITKRTDPNCFAHNSATKYRSEGVLYSKRTAGHPLSYHIKTINVAFLQAE